MSRLSRALAVFYDGAYADGRNRELWEHSHPSQELVATLATLNLKPNSIVLDIGAGSGVEAVFLAEQGFRAVAVDFSGEALLLAKERARLSGIEILLCCADATRLPFPGEIMAFANDRGCFHIVQTENRTQYASEIHRVMLPGGSLLIRGSDVDVDEEGLLKVDADDIDRHFETTRFSRGPVLPIAMQTDARTSMGNLVILRKQSKVQG